MMHTAADVCWNARPRLLSVKSHSCIGIGCPLQRSVQSLQLSITHGHTVEIPVAPVAASARVCIETLLLKAAQCKHAVCKGCRNFLVMVNSDV